MTRWWARCTNLVLGSKPSGSPRAGSEAATVPDLRLMFPGQQVLVDVVVSHSPAPSFHYRGQSLRMLGEAKKKQSVMRNKHPTPGQIVRMQKSQLL